jgi:hypothetical protein
MLGPEDPDSGQSLENIIDGLRVDGSKTPAEAAYDGVVGSDLGVKGSLSQNDVSSQCSGGGQQNCGASSGGGKGGGLGGLFGKMLCTLAYKNGHISERVIKADYAQGEKASIYTKEGYWFLARPITRFFEFKPTLFKYTILPFVTSWAKHMAYKEGVEDSPSLLGGLMEMVGLPVCYITGLLVTKFRK